jgi:2-succinyl-6-hydroxy-2,4-cyclohexadiene-1-carboxylate synthase
MAYVTTLDAMQLFVEELGAGTPLLLVHGFTGSSGAWGREVKTALARRFRLLCVDLLGHGRSDKPEDPDRYALEAMVDDLCTVIDAVGIPRAVWAGYSMGGRIALGAGVLRPTRVSALLLESASPGLASTTRKAARVASDEALARMLETQGIEAFVDHWMKLPLFRTQSRLTRERFEEERRRRLRNAPRALAACLRGLGSGAQPSFWPALSGLHIPTRLLVGEMDKKFRAIAHEMERALPQAQVQTLAATGHATHLECPTEYVDAVRGFCEDTIDARGDAKDEGPMDARA